MPCQTMIRLAIELDQAVRTCSVRNDKKRAHEGESSIDGSKNDSRLEFTVDTETFFSLYEELTQAQTLLQNIQL